MTKHYFHQGGGRDNSAIGEYQDSGAFAKEGMEYRTETYGNDGNLYHVTVNQINQSYLGSGRYFPYVQLTFECDYPGGGTPRVTATQFVYDQYENLTNKIEYGEVTGFNPASVGSFTFTDITSADNQVYNTTYATIISNSYLVDLPATAIMADANNNTVRETDYTYNPSSGTIATKLTRISSTSFATDSYGNYNAYGLVGLTTDPVGVQTAITYDSSYNTYPATTTVGGTFTNTTTYDARSGALAVSTDPAGLTVSNRFDVLCRPVETDQIPINGGSVVWKKKIGYTLGAINLGNAVSYEDATNNDGVGGIETRTYMDGFARPIQACVQGENNNFRVVSVSYDERGKLFLTTWPSFATSATYSKPVGQTAFWVGFDAAGRIATNQLVTVSFNTNGAFSSAVTLSGDTGSPLGAVTRTYANGSDPWWIIVTDEDGQIRRYGLDAYGRTNQIQEVDGGNTYTNFLNYNVAGDLTNIVNAKGENIYWAYNDKGGVVAMADPYLGQWTYVRDYAGRLRVQTDARGDVVSNSYINPSGNQDALGRLQVQTVYGTNYSSHTLVPAYTNRYVYDTSDDANYTVYPGLLYKVIDGQGYDKHGYDPRTRTITSTRYLNINSNTCTTRYTFDDDDKIASIAYPNSGPSITNAYYHGGSLNLVSRIGGNGSYYTISAAAYDAFDRATNFTYGNTLPTTRIYYPVSQRLKSISAGSSGSVFLRSYQYTAANDITNISGTGLTNAVSISYYTLHRIKTYTGLTNSYGYDATGNLTNNIEGGGSKYAYANPRLQAVRSAFGYTNLYDLCGNMLVRHGGLTNSQAMVYDPENRLSVIAQAGVMSDEFGYGFDGARLWKRINQNPTNIQVWIGNLYEQKGGKTLFHVFAGSEQVCTFETNSPLGGGSSTNAVGYYYHEDNLNTSSALSSSGGSQVEVDVYYPFGRVQTASPQASFQISRRFTGQVFDAESGLYYYNARYYDPELGRFTQPDTTIPDLSNPQSYNRYSYCRNDPLTYNDPSGHVSTIAAFFGFEGSEATSDLDSWAKGLTYRNGSSRGYASFADAKNQLAEQKDPGGYNADVRMRQEQSTAFQASLPAVVGMANLELNAESAIVAPEAKAVIEETAAEKAAGPYANLEDHPSAGPGKDFTQAQKRNILNANREKNGGTLLSDESGTQAGAPQQSKKGITPPSNEAQVDHIEPKSKGGSNSYKNAQVLTREENLKKSDN
jgi:RHS repeat-associated protein